MKAGPKTIGWFWVAGQALFLGIWIISLPKPSHWWQTVRSGWMIFAATLLLMSAGLVLALLSTLHLGRHLTPTPEPRRSGTLVTNGVYRHARHPMYGSLLLLIWGATLPVATIPTLLSAIVATAFFTVKSAYEEQRLADRYPGYAAYRQTTHRFFPFPFHHNKRRA